METKKLRRSEKEKVIGGVAGGLGEYFSTDPVIFRILFVVLSFTGGGGVLVYLLMWIFIPRTEIPFSSQQQSKEKTDTEPIFDEQGEPIDAEYVKEIQQDTSIRKKNGNLIGGSILIFIGLFFIADDFFPWLDWEYLWPIALIIAGLAIIKINYQSKKQ